MLENVDIGIKLHGGQKTILTTATETVDAILFTTSLSNTWILQVVCGTKSEHSIVAGIKTLADIEHIRYGVSGDYINYALDVVIDGLEMKLSITNNEGSSIIIKFVRIFV